MVGMQVQERYAEAFTLWDQKYREDPDSFEYHFDGSIAYGEASAAFFVKLLSEVG